MNNFSITNIKENMIFSDDLKYCDSTYDFIIYKGVAVSKWHKYQMLFNGVYNLKSNGELVKEKNKKENKFKINEDIENLISKLNVKIQECEYKDLDIYKYLPKLKLYSEYLQLYRKYTKIQKLIYKNLSGYKYQQIIDKFCKDIIKFTKNNDEKLSNFINYLDKLDFENNTIYSSGFRKMIISILISHKYKINYQYLFYAIKAIFINSLNNSNININRVINNNNFFSKYILINVKDNKLNYIDCVIDYLGVQNIVKHLIKNHSVNNDFLYTEIAKILNFTNIIETLFYKTNCDGFKKMLILLKEEKYKYFIKKHEKLLRILITILNK